MVYTALLVCGFSRCWPARFWAACSMTLLGCAAAFGQGAEVGFTRPTAVLVRSKASEDTVLTLTVRISNPGAGPVEVMWATEDAEAKGPDDFKKVSGALLFGMGEKEKKIDITIKKGGGKRLQTAYVVLSNAKGARLGASRATFTIVDAAYPAPTDIVGNKYGNWRIALNLNDAPAAGKKYSANAVVTFFPDKAEVKAAAVSFVQNAKLLNGLKMPVFPGKRIYRAAGDWAIDQEPLVKYGWYPYTNAGLNYMFGADGSSPNPLMDATLLDMPFSERADAEFGFETYAIAKDGDQANQVYGGLRWGFTAKDGKLTASASEFIPAQTKAFKDAVDEWNDQARSGKPERMNAEGQERLPRKGKFMDP